MTINRSLVIVLLVLAAVLATGLSGCGKKEEKADDKHGDDKAKKTTAPKKRAPKKAPPKKRSGPAKSGSSSSDSGGSSKKARRTGKVSVDELLINNPDRIENLLKAKDYKYPFKYNIFRDYVVREQEKIDNDKDGSPDIYDDDDDNDGFPDTVEIEQGFDPKNKYSHPQRTTLGGGSVIGGGLGGAGASGAGGGAAGPVAAGPAGGKGGKAAKGAESHGTPVGEVYETTGIYFRGIFGLRNSKVAVLKVIKDDEEKMLLKREGESFKGIQKGKSYFIKEINLQKDYIRVREESSGEVLTLTFEKKDKNAAAKAPAAVAPGKPGAKGGKAAAKKPAPKKRDSKAAKKPAANKK